MKPATKNLLNQGLKLALSAGALALFSRVAGRIPGPLGKLARGAVALGAVMAPKLGHTQGRR